MPDVARQAVERQLLPARAALRGALRVLDERKLLPIPILHPLHDDPVQLLRRLREPELLMEVARPLFGAHAHHVRLRAVVPAAAALAGELLAHVVPDLLAVDDDAVEVEDDGVDHAAR